jgi:hypothetical protein
VNAGAVASAGRRDEDENKRQRGAAATLVILHIASRFKRFTRVVQASWSVTVGALSIAHRLQVLYIPHHADRALHRSAMKGCEDG